MNVMTSKAKSIFIEMVGHISSEQWKDHLDKVCVEDESLRQEIESLLNAHTDDDSFLAQPAIAPTIAKPSPNNQLGSEIGPYKLREQIGEGGMGVVWLAEQSEPVKRKVALKIIRPGMASRDVVARFEAERQALAMMDHPNIARVLDGGATDSGQPYFVMELVQGLPITEYCDQHNLSTKCRLKLFATVCRAVQHAHQKGVIHRDLKPSNIIVSEIDGTAVPKVIDFGVAKAIHQPLTEETLYTHFAQMVGTPLYMSPEQTGLGVVDVDTRSDVYSLGVLLYELLTGKTPFDSDALKQAGFDEMRRIIQEDEPPRPSTMVSTLNAEALSTISQHRGSDSRSLSSSLKGELDWIVMKALEKDRRRRYESASKLAEDVEHFLNNEAVEACPPSGAYRFRKFARRNKSVIAMTTGIAAALLLGICGTTWQAIQATQERDRADTEAAIAKAVNEFLQNDLLGMAGADSQAEALITPDPNIKLRTVLDRAAESVEERFPDSPLVSAAIHHTIGNSYRSIGDYKKAETHYQRATNLRAAVLGDEAIDTLLSQHFLGRVYWLEGRYDLAEKLHRRTFELRLRTLGENHVDTLTSMNNLANVYADQGRLKEAEAMQRRTLEIQLRALGNDHRDTVGSMVNLASILMALGNWEEGLRLDEQALAIFRRTLGEEHPHTLMTATNVAADYVDLGHYVEAESLLRQTLAIKSRNLGKEHPDTLLSMDSLAMTYRQQRRFIDAEKLMEQTLDITQRTLGEEHPRTLTCMQHLALIYADQKRLEETVTLISQTLESQRRTLGREHKDTLLTMQNLALTYGRQRRLKEAESLCRETLEIQRTLLGDNHPDTLASMHTLACICADQGNLEDANSLSSTSLRVLRRTLGDDHPQTIKARKLQSVLRNEKYEQAPPTLHEAADGFAEGNRGEEQSRSKAEAEKVPAQPPTPAPFQEPQTD